MKIYALKELKDLITDLEFAVKKWPIGLNIQIPVGPLKLEQFDDRKPGNGMKRIRLGSRKMTPKQDKSCRALHNAGWPIAKLILRYKVSTNVIRGSLARTQVCLT